ncbi:class I SAM-dependent methyltransferase [Brevundimonas aurifodinae]
MITQARRFARKIAPPGLVEIYGLVRRKIYDARNLDRSPQAVFSEIYSKGLWGGQRGVFHSGTGSHTASIVEPYVGLVSRVLADMPAGQRRVVDLGCGDFQIGRHVLASCDSYSGVDVVPQLVQHLQSQYSGPNVKFRCLDIVDDDLPDGDVCLVRQVLQHLSNEQVSKVLSKLNQYKIVLITEHVPSHSKMNAPNVDKVHGGGIRLASGSGLYVERPPFSFAPDQMQVVLELPGHQVGVADAGLIRTQKFDLRPDA